MSKELANKNSALKIKYEQLLHDREREYLEKIGELRAQISQLKVDHRRELTQLALENETLRSALQNERGWHRSHR